MFGVTSSRLYQAVEIRFLLEQLLVLSITKLVLFDQIILIISVDPLGCRSITYTLLIEEFECG